MQLDIFRKIGLSDGEVKIYGVLLDLGNSPVRRIHEHTGIERRNIYDILNKLIERGLVAYITENRKRFFHAVHPNRIIGYIDEKKGELEKIKREAASKLPSLIEKFNMNRTEIEAELFRGPEGVKSVWEDMLNYPETRWIGSGRYVPKEFPHFFVGWNKRRIKKKNIWFNILRAEMKGKVKKMAYEKQRFLPKDFSGDPAVIAVYGDKVVNFILEVEFFAFVIESKMLAGNYRRYHKYLWENVAKP